MNRENMEDAKQYLLSLYRGTDDPRTIDIAKQENFLRSEYYLSEHELQAIYMELEREADVYSPAWLQFMMAMQHQTILVTITAGAVNICQYKPDALQELEGYLQGYIVQSEGTQRVALQALQRLLTKIQVAQRLMQIECDYYMHTIQQFNHPPQ